MDRVGRPRGLIRHASAAEVRGGTAHRWLTGRVTAYSGVWLLLVAVLAVLLSARPDLDVLVLRQAGTLYVALPGGDIANFYTLQALNRTGHSADFAIEVLEPAGATVTPLGSLTPVAPYSVLDGRFLLRIARSRLTGPSTHVRVRIRSHGQTVQSIESAFLGPGSTN